MQAELETLQEELEDARGPAEQARDASAGRWWPFWSCSPVFSSCSRPPSFGPTAPCSTPTPSWATVGPVFHHPEVDAAVATRATGQLFTQLHLQTD